VDRLARINDRINSQLPIIDPFPRWIKAWQDAIAARTVFPQSSASIRVMLVEGISSISLRHEEPSKISKKGTVCGLTTPLNIIRSWVRVPANTQARRGKEKTGFIEAKDINPTS
jgi:hypothetical protein